jgi:hypothetical protein
MTARANLRQIGLVSWDLIAIYACIRMLGANGTAQFDPDAMLNHWMVAGLEVTDPDETRDIEFECAKNLYFQGLNPGETTFEWVVGGTALLWPANVDVGQDGIWWNPTLIAIPL